jgi:hypothetical protein
MWTENDSSALLYISCSMDREAWMRVFVGAFDGVFHSVQGCFQVF